MKPNYPLLAAVSAVFLFSAQETQARPTFYAGLDYAHLDFNPTEQPGSANLHTAGVHLGVQPSPYLAAEIRAGTGMGSKTFAGSDVKINHYYGAYLLPQLPLHRYLSTYLVAGTTYGKLEISRSLYGHNYTRIERALDFSYGAGIRIKDHEQKGGVSIALEYTRFISRKNVDIDALLMSVSYHF
ncbi:porin family protein [Zobellella sp. DQSA1]|uniref:porin family protein n=1 Tax=Zobellella sp. DQSA1 TaxID=3342386 RepID=UPI0035C162B7